MARELLTRIERDIATAIVDELEPSESPLLNQLLEPEPLRLFRGSRAIGFGVNEVVEVIAPTVMLIVPWAWSIVASEFQDQSTDRLRKIARRALGRKAPELVIPSLRRGVNRAELQTLIVAELVRLNVRPRRALEIGELLSARLIEASKASIDDDRIQ